MLLFFPRRNIVVDYNATSEIIPDVFAVIIGQKTKDFGVFAVFMKYLTLSLKCPAIKNCHVNKLFVIEEKVRRRKKK